MLHCSFLVMTACLPIVNVLLPKDLTFQYFIFSVMTGILPAFRNVSKELAKPAEVFTMFVPSDHAFTYMPSHRSHALRDPELLKSVGTVYSMKVRIWLSSN